MNTYKVSFTEGHATTAEVVNPILYSDIKKFKVTDRCVCIEWYLVECDNENDAIKTAEIVVAQIWGKFLGEFQK